MEILFWRRQSDAQRRIGTTTIYCRITVNGVRENLGSTNITIPFADFDTASQRVTSSNPNFASFNLRLQHEFEVPINAIFTEFLVKKQPVTALAIKQRFLGEEKESVLLADAFEKFLKDFELKTKPRIVKGNQLPPLRSKSTLRPLKVCKNKLLTYLISRRQLKISVEELTENWYDDYSDWLYAQHEDSTCKKHLRTLCQVTAWAKKKKLVPFDPFADIAVESEEAKDPHFLTQQQFEYWLSHSFSSEILQRAADLFAIYCRTGFHYQDLQQVIREPEKYIRTGLNNQLWIYKEREKTNVMAKVPAEAFLEVSKIIEKYGGWQHLPLMHNQHLNAYLKICVAEINSKLPPEVPKIYEKLSCKHGRCTLTDWFYNTLGGNDNALLPLLGRKSKKGLERYARPDERAVINALKGM